jgi:ribonuclease E
MSEEARDPAAEAAAGESKASPARPRRRRRGGRGRSRASGQASTQEASEPGTAEAAELAAGTEPAPPAKEPKQSPEGQEKPVRRRRASGTRRRRTTSETAGQESAAEPTAESQPSPETEGGPEATGATEPGPERPKETQSQKRRRRRRRRTAAQPAGEPGAAPAASVEAPAPEQPERAAKPARAPAAASGRGPAAASSTRTRGRERDRRRPTTLRRRRDLAVVPERRTDKVMLITEQDERVRIAVLEGRELVEHYVTRVGARSMAGNVYLGRVQNVLPGMEAAFVDIGRGRNAVLYAGEVAFDEEVEESDRRIEQALKPGQSVLVQVTKDPLGGKGARLTAQISLPGRFLVYVPDGGVYGISRRLPDAERRRLRDVLKTIRPSEVGVIVRTAAEAATEEDLAADLDRLKKTWDSIKRKSRRAKAPAVIYEEPELTIRVIRDVFSPAEFQEIVTDAPEIFEKVRAYLKDVAPGLLERVHLHQGPLPVFEERHVIEQIHKALERKVWLPSGGYVVIDRTEAMTVIDVNTGRSVGKTNLEETVVGTNIEAAKEIARQLRLRDIGGIIVIDFIDMLLEKNRDLVIRTFREALAMDKTRSQVFDITPLGLLEVTRKKVSAGLVESFSETCPTCEGRGILLTHEI